MFKDRYLFDGLRSFWEFYKRGMRTDSKIVQHLRVQAFAEMETYAKIGLIRSSRKW